MHGVVVNRLGGLSLPRKSVVRLTDPPDMTLDVYRGRKTTTKTTTDDKNQQVKCADQAFKSLNLLSVSHEVSITPKILTFYFSATVNFI